MSESPRQTSVDDAAVDAEALKKAEEFIEEEEGRTSKVGGWLGVFVTAVAIVMSLFHLYSAYSIVTAQVMRPVHVGFVLFLVYLLFPVAQRYRHRIMWWDWIVAFAAVAIVTYIIRGGEDFWGRNTLPDKRDILFGVVLILMIPEGMRRASGWVTPPGGSAFPPFPLFLE